MLSSFRADIGTTQMQMSQTLDRLDKEAHAASYMDNKVAQGKQDAEFIAAKQHRDAVTAEFIFQSREWKEQCHERQEQTFERREQNNWRILEKNFWEEQIKANQIVTAAIADEMRRSLFTWFSPRNPEDHHNAALQLQYPGTCTWILDTPEFEEWTREGDQLLWVHGIPGAGKTILAAASSSIYKKVPVRMKLLSTTISITEIPIARLCGASWPPSLHPWQAKAQRILRLFRHDLTMLERLDDHLISISCKNALQNVRDISRLSLSL